MDEEALARLAARLDEPDDYMVGVCGDELDEPDNILFLRRDPERRISFFAPRDGMYHRRYALTLNLRTAGIVCVNECSFALPVAHAAVVFPYQSHYYMVDQTRFLWLVATFDHHQLPPSVLMYRSTRVREYGYALIARMLALFLELRAKPDAGKAALLQRYLGCLLRELALEPQYIDSRQPFRPDDDRLRLFEEINGCIYSRLDDPALSVKGLAREHGVSVSHLYDLFGGLCACTPGEYIRKLRINHAIKLLGSRELLVFEVARRCGFTSLAVFSRSFRTMVGLSPSQYLKRGNPARDAGPSP